MSGQGETPFDTEKPPSVEFRRSPNEVPGGGMRSGWGAVVGHQVVADFEGNPEAAAPFFRWLSSGDAWVAFGDWYDEGGYRA